MRRTERDDGAPGADLAGAPPAERRRTSPGAAVPIVRCGTGDPLTSAANAVVLCLPSDHLHGHPVMRALGRTLVAHIKAAAFDGKPEQLLDLPTLGRLRVPRLILIGAGPRRTLSVARLRHVVAAGIRAAQNAKVVSFVLPRDEVDVRSVGEGVGLGAYRFDKYFTGTRRPRVRLTKVSVYFPSRSASSKDRAALASGVKISQAVALARDTVNEPPNVLNPQALAKVARRLARQNRLLLKVFDDREILRRGMNLLHAVGRGSANKPRFIHLTYKPRHRRAKKVVFVGKGLTFDSGGLCLKPAPGMWELKADMAGAAAVLGLMAAVCVVRPEVEIHGIVGAAENMPGGAAYRPGDVFKCIDGKTVEIINTDAEGRLVLADALSYAARLAPDLIVDIATLTGATLTALGKTCSAFYTMDDGLARALEQAANEAGERLWRMPLLDDMEESLRSEVADLKHVGENWGGSITAALFLRQFVGQVRWIHCDIAGTALSDQARGIVPKGATGHALLTFLRLVERIAARKN